MADYGGKIAKVGYAYSDGDNHLILNSKYPLLKMKASGAGTLTCTNGSASVTINTHNLGYKPMFYVWTEYVDINNGNKIEKVKQCSWRDYYGLGVWAYYYAYVTTTTLVLDCYTAWEQTQTFNFNWVIFYDPIL